MFLAFRALAIEVGKKAIDLYPQGKYTGGQIFKVRH
jgi:hypothetical protein